MKFATQRRGSAVLPTLVILILVLALLSGSAFWLFNLTIVAIYATAVVGLNVLVGYAGQVSFAQTAFMAIGGYSYAILAGKHEISPWVGLAVGVLVAAAAAIIIGLPLLRLRGHYLTMATFAIAMGTFAFVTAATGLTGGAIGISAVPPLGIGSLSSTSAPVALVGAWMVLALAIVIGVVLRGSHIGRAWRTIAAREEVAVSLGIRVNRFKIIAFVISAVFAAIAGGSYVAFTSYVSPDLYTATIAVNLFVMLFFGGNGKALGPIIGAAFVVILPLQISSLANFQGIIFDCLLLVVILLMPGGLLSKPNLKPVTRWLTKHTPSRTQATPPPPALTDPSATVDSAVRAKGSAK